MLKTSPFLAALLIAACTMPAQAETKFPISEDSYLQAASERFDARDKNHDGFLDKTEMTSGLEGSARDEMSGMMFISGATVELCTSMAKTMKAVAPPSQAPAAAEKPMPKQSWLDAYRHAFEQSDTSHDHILTQEEAAATEKTMADTCRGIPKMMEAMKAAQDAMKKMPAGAARGMPYGVPPGAPQGIPPGDGEK